VIRRASLVVACAAATASAGSPWGKSGISDWTKVPPPGAEPTFRPPVPVRERLANGLTVLVIENHALPIVAMELVVPGAGAADDPAGQGGLAALTADLLDEGAGGRTALELAEEEDRLGAELDLGVDSDAAYISAHALAKTFAPTLALMTSVVTRPAFDAKELARVQGDRLTSLEQRRDRPREVAGILLHAALYGPGSAYGHPDDGGRDELAKLALPDARRFYATHWNPAAMTLVVAGDVDRRTLRAQLDAGLGAWRPAAAVRPALPVAAAARLAHRLLLANRPGAEQSDVRIGLVGPLRSDPRYFAFEVMANALGGGFTSRLEQRLREQLGITYGVVAGMDWRLASGPFQITSAIQTPSTARGITEALQIVGGLASADLPAAELDNAKQNLIRALPALFDTDSATASTFGELALLRLPDDFYTRYAAEVRTVTAADVRAVAAALVPQDQLVIAVVGDLAKIRAELDKLKLGDPALFDLYGLPLGAATGQ
jgi:predicted Zn-dependent peptidase